MSGFGWKYDIKNIQMTIPLLPFKQDVETKIILKKASKAHQALAELKGIAKSIPNEAILINKLSLQEAKESSAIENIITTHDELYKSNSLTQNFRWIIWNNLLIMMN